MLPKSLSASALNSYFGCPARFKADYIDRVPNLSGVAADKGTVCHAVLQRFVDDGLHIKGDIADLLHLLDDEYWKYFSDQSSYQDCADMLENWLDKHPPSYWEDRDILSTEVKESFKVPTSAGKIPFNFIWDRADRLDEDTIEVTDYKSWRWPVSPEEIKGKIQPRAYALACAIKYKVDNIWVSYDQLRYDIVGIRFTRDDNIATWKWLKTQAERILADDGTTESLNPECRFCVRSLNCATLLAHAQAGGALGVTDLTDAVDRRAELEYVRSALVGRINDLDEFILAALEERGDRDYKTQENHLEIKLGSRRSVDSRRAAPVVGPEVMMEHGDLKITVVDELLKNGALTSEQKSLLRQLVRKNFTKPQIKVSPIVFGDE